jgi:hypothetical protein
MGTALNFAQTITPHTTILDRGVVRVRRVGRAKGGIGALEGRNGMRFALLVNAGDPLARRHNWRSGSAAHGFQT